MRVSTLRVLAQNMGVRLPETLVDNTALKVKSDQRGWFRFQRSYDAARKVVQSEEAMRLIIRQAAQDDAREGSRRLEIQIDPTSYAPFVGGITPALEIVMDEARSASLATGVEIGIIVAASRIRHPLEARTLARLACQYAGDGIGEVVGFGLSNDERRGETASWEAAFAIARKAGLPAVPHAGELLGPEHIRHVLTFLHPTRLGHGVRAYEDPRLLEEIARKGIALEVCPESNVSLGVFETHQDIPLRTLIRSGVNIALGADDPLLFLSRLTDQYAIARELGLSDEEIAELARGSIRASFASETSKKIWLQEIDEWLATPSNEQLPH